MADEDWPSRLWFGTGRVAGVARTLLWPAEVLFAAGVRARGALYDRDALRAESPALPTLAIGNLTVGGTGKTPIAAWAAAQLLARGGRPAIVLRGYGDDEPKVHALLNPAVPVLVSPVRAEGVQRARAQGCDVAVLDDAFQHRQIRRNADWVLISADRWMDRRRLLPAGPWREPLSGLGRATAGIITRKAASRETAATIAREVRRIVPGVPLAVASLQLDRLRAVRGSETLPIAALAGARVLLIAGIGDPGALRRQLETRGARVRGPALGDHHAFTAAEVASLAGSVQSDEMVICTLKDAVKLDARWPRAAPALWYVSQRVTFEEGEELLGHSLDALLQARPLDSDSVPVQGPFP